MNKQPADRVWSRLEIKSIDEENRIIEGVATTPSTDLQDDVIDPMGGQYDIPMPFLMDHGENGSDDSVGHVIYAKPTKNGIPVRIKILQDPVLPHLDRAWAKIRLKLVNGLSIGFKPIEYEPIKGSFGYLYKKWRWLELSAVVVAANPDCSITSIKSIDETRRAASGRKSGNEDRKPPGVSGTQAKAAKSGLFHTRKESTVNKTLQEQIAALAEARAAKVAAMNTIQEKAMEGNRGKDAAEKESFETLDTEIKSIDEELVDLRRMEVLNVKAAKEVTKENTETAEKAAATRGGEVLLMKSNLPKGTTFTRYVMALGRCKGNTFEASEFAKQWKDTPEVSLILKAASDAGSTTDADWASKLVTYTNAANEFVELLRPMTILGKFGTNGIPSLRQVPFNIRMATQTGGGTYGWVGEGAAKAVGELVIGEITLRWAKAAGIIVVTDELMRFSTPSVESVVRNDMLKGMAAFSDLQFISPQVFAVANVSPASVTNGVTDVPATGTDAEALRTDLATLWGTFFAANLTPTSGVFIMSNRMAMRISLMRNALGQKEYPDMTPLGGVLEGFPVIASEAVPDTSDGGMIVFLNADDIFFSDDGPVTIDASREASLQMNTTPDNPTTASTVLVSLWQRNLVALRAERYMNWQKRRAGAVGYISGAAYGQGT